MSDQGKNTTPFSSVLMRYSPMLVMLVLPVAGFGAQGALFPGQIFPVDNGPLSLATADINGDGVADIVTGNYSASSVSVLLGSGGSFGEAVNYPIDGIRVYDVALTDMNGDGNADVVTANNSSGNVSIFLGDGTGAFAAATSYPATSFIRSLAVADVDGDGDQDVIAGDNLLLGDGSGGLGAATSLGFFSAASALEDMNSDGVPDLVSTDSVSVSIRLGDGVGGFNPAVLQPAGTGVQSLAVADLDGDGDNDVVTGNANDNSISILLGDDAGSLAPAVPYTTGTTPRGVAVADFNADGALDVATGNIGSDDISILLSDGAGVFAAPVSYSVGHRPYSLVVVDVNDDGNTDIAAANFSSAYLSVLLGDGRGGFVSGAVEHPVGDAVASVAAGDVAGSNAPDIVTANLVSDSISLLAGDGAGNFAAQTQHATGNGPADVVLADVDDDGVTDALTAEPLADGISVMLGESVGGFSVPEQYSAGDGVRSLALGDLDDDGALDVVTANFGGDDISVLLGDGDGGFGGSGDDEEDDEDEDDKISGGASSHHAVGDGPRAVTLADVNADGSLDALTVNMASEDVSVLLGDGDGGFTSVEDYLAGDGPSDLALGDVNDDGNLDVLVTNFDGDDISVLLGTGAGGFGEASNFIAGDGPRSLTLTDVNDDSILDAVIANFGNDTVGVLLGDGAGSFHAPLFYQVGDGPISLTMADFNTDGREDIAVANENADSVSVLLQQNIAPVALGGSLTVAMNGVETEKLQASDPNGDSLAFRLVAPAKHGTVTLIDAKTGGYSYAPTTGYSGSDSFDYKASDGQADSAAQTVAITVSKHAGENAGGGAMSFWTILVLPLLALRRRFAALPEDNVNNSAKNIAKGRAMYRFLILFLLGVMGQAHGAMTACTANIADGHACENIDLLSHMSIVEMGGSEDADHGVPIEWVSDMWGWVDDQGTSDSFTDDREYAIVGRFCGTSFIDITDPENPVYLGNLPDHSEFVTGHNACQELVSTKTTGSRQDKMHETDGSIWRDIKVYGHYAIIVAETNIGEDAPHNGVQIFDLYQLRGLNSGTLPVLFTRSSYTHYDGIGNSHNVFVNQLTGRVYPVGSDQCSGGPHVIDITDPNNPVEAGCYPDLGYTHDIQCVIYTGPDTEHVGKEICFGSNGNVGGPNTLAILDATDPANISEIANEPYPNSAYSHQGWLSEDQRYFFHNDELDELSGAFGDFGSPNPVPTTRLLVWDVSDLDNPVLTTQFAGRTGSTDHNNYVQGNYLYQSNYTAGLNVLDISDPLNPVQAGYFDDFIPYDTPGGNDAFLGTWSNYPWYPSGTVAISDITGGLYLVKPGFGVADRISVASINSSARALDGDVDAAGETVEFEMIVENSGPDTTNGLTAVIRISNASLTSVDAGSAPVTCNIVAGTANILCNGQQLAASESYTVDIAAVVDSELDVQAEILANAYNVDINEADNADKAVVIVGQKDEDDDDGDEDDGDEDDDEGGDDDGGGAAGLWLLAVLLGAGLLRKRMV